MTMKRVRVNPDDPRTFPKGRVNYDGLDRTTEADIARHKRQDDAEAMQEIARYARRVRKRLGLSRAEFARRIHVSADTVRNWERGISRPTGTAKALLKILDNAPETGLRTL